MLVENIIIHHAGVEDGPTAQWGAIRKYHIEHNGWKDIGYHAGCELIGDHYEVLQGRPWTMDGAHTIGMNDKALGFCFVGDFNEMPPPYEQIDAGAVMIREWLRLYNLAPKDIHPHRRFSSTDCPGKDFDWGYLMWAVKQDV